MLARQAFHSYVSNFKAVLTFALLLVFVVPFFYLSGAFIGSGSLMLDYNFLRLDVVQVLGLLVLMALYLFFYSLFSVVVIMAVRHDISKVRIHHYLSEKMYHFTLRLFSFYFVFSLVAALISALLANAGLPMVVMNVVWLVAFAAFLFVPQAIVVDEKHLRDSVDWNFEFIKENQGAFLNVLVIGAVLMLALPVVEFALESTLFIGKYVALIIALVFVAPFMECVKTYAYMQKFALIRHAHRVQEFSGAKAGRFAYRGA